jgi:ferredoxin-NADP reductase
MRFEDHWTVATLTGIRDLTPTIREFTLRPDDCAQQPYAVGSHIKVGVLIDGQPDVRSYSLVGEARRGSIALPCASPRIPAAARAISGRWHRACG